jgi:hypothetical protein
MADRTTLTREVDALSQRIAERLQEFRDRGEFAQAGDTLADLAERHSALRRKLNEVSDADWERRHPELARDHATLYDDFIKLEEKLDADAMRANPQGRVPGAKSGLV